MKKSIIRLSAYTVDFAILMSVLVGLQLVIYYVFDGLPFNAFTTGIQVYIWVVLTMSTPVWMYFIILERSNFSTLGKHLFGLEVLNHNSGRISNKQSLIRTFIKLLPWEITHLSMLGIYFKNEPEVNIGFWIANSFIVIYLLVLFVDKGENSIHDRIVKTKIKFN